MRDRRRARLINGRGRRVGVISAEEVSREGGVGGDIVRHFLGVWANGVGAGGSDRGEGNVKTSCGLVRGGKK